jgi:DNA polymerase-4
MRIELGTERPFLAPLGIQKIPMIGEKTTSLLQSMGIYKVYTLQQMPPELLTNVLGENGLMIWKKANGVDNSAVEPFWERKSISSEETFEQDTIDVARLKAVLVRMTEKLAFQLRNEQKLTACVTVKLRYSNFDTHTQQARVGYTCADHVLIARVKELFEKLYQRRMLVRLIGVRFSHLVQGAHQINLFEDTEELINLYQAIDKMKRRFGEDKLHRAISTGGKRGMNPFNGK